MKRLVKFAAIAAATLIAFCAASCSVNITTNCETGWKVEKYETTDGENGEAVRQYACFYITRNSNPIDEVWINIGAIEGDEATVYLGRYVSSTYSDSGTAEAVTITKKAASEAQNGWIMIKESYNLSSSYVKIATTGGITINEVAFLNADGDLLKTEIQGAYIVYENDSGKLVGVKGDRGEIEELELESSPMKLVDEQEKFEDR